MSQLQTRTKSEIFYLDSDGKPMADNTKQFRWIVMIQQNLESLFANDPNVFVAGDLLWYPQQGDNKTCTAPDVLVVFGRPKGDRGSYKQWLENNTPPQVVFEILSPSNTQTEMNKKLLFYDRYGVEEYYVYDPDKNDLGGWLRQGERLDVIDPIADWVSPRLGIRFHSSSEELQIYRPDGVLFTTLNQERQRAEQERQRAEQAEAQLAKLAEQLRAAGIEPQG